MCTKKSCKLKANETLTMARSIWIQCYPSVIYLDSKCTELEGLSNAISKKLMRKILSISQHSVFLLDSPSHISAEFKLTNILHTNQFIILHGLVHHFQQEKWMRYSSPIQEGTVIQICFHASISTSEEAQVAF